VQGTLDLSNYKAKNISIIEVLSYRTYIPWLLHVGISKWLHKPLKRLPPKHEKKLYCHCFSLLSSEETDEERSNRAVEEQVNGKVTREVEDALSSWVGEKEVNVLEGFKISPSCPSNLNSIKIKTL
jgi:hypothetical protein